MWQKLYDALAKIFTISLTVERHDKRIEDLQSEIEDLTALVHRLIIELNRVSDKQESDRENTRLWVENQILRWERRLPPAGKDE